MPPRPTKVAAAASAAFCLLLIPATAPAQDSLGRVDIGQPAPGFTAQGADGRAHRLADYAGKVVVLEWTSPVCPYTEIVYKNGVMQALQRQARSMGAAWLAIDTAAPNRPGYLSPEAARRRTIKLHAVVSAFLSDPDGKIGRLYGARVTPTLYIIGPDGRLLYQGPPRSDPASGAPIQRFAHDALDDIAAKRPLGTPEARAYGCAVEY
jgi:hypothetical protein